MVSLVFCGFAQMENARHEDTIIKICLVEVLTPHNITLWFLYTKITGLYHDGSMKWAVTNCSPTKK